MRFGDLASFTQQDSKELQRKIVKTRNHLNSLERKLEKMQRRKTSGKKQIDLLEVQILKKYPCIKIDRDILLSVGKLPSNPVSKDKEIIRQVIADRYG